MARPKKHYTTDQLRPRPRDLFGQVSVTQSELENWVRAVAPHIAHSQRRMLRYIDGWNVADKVRAAKLAGTFYQTIEQIAPPFDRCARCQANEAAGS